MRIAGYIQHPTMKITIFQYEGRYSLKFETPQFEQTFKLSIEQYPDIRAIHILVDEKFLREIETRFQSMADQMILKIQNTDTADDDLFPEII